MKKKEKIYTKLGVEFGTKAGLTATVQKALYGLKSSGNALYMHLCDTLKKLGFKQSLLNPALWYKLRENKKSYDYFSHHVDNFLVSGSQPTEWIKQLEKSYTITGKTEPKTHLGMDFNKENTHTWTIGIHSYITDAAKRVSKILKKPLKNKKTPTVIDFHPEIDTIPLFTPEETNYYQRIQGITQWINTMGRVDNSYTTNQMSANNAAPRKGHFIHPEHTFSYLEIL